MLWRDYGTYEKLAGFNGGAKGWKFIWFDIKGNDTN